MNRSRSMTIVQRITMARLIAEGFSVDQEENTVVRMNRSHSLTGPQLAKVNEYTALGFVIDQSSSGESVEMTRGAQRIAICWNGMVKAAGARK